MKIIINILQYERTIEIETEPTCKIRDLKQKVLGKDNSEYWHFHQYGKILNESKTLQDYSISDKSTICLTHSYPSG